MENEERKQLCVSGSRRTRSQAAPEWPVEGALILVNEIAAVEADCSNALSSYQKWNIIAENCTALDKPRTSNQCRRKWDSLVSEHNKIKQWECSLGVVCIGLWKVKGEENVGYQKILTVSCSKRLMILTRVQEAKAAVNVSKNLCRGKAFAKLQKEEPPRSPTSEKPQKRLLEDPVNSPTEENPQQSCFKEKYQTSHEEDPVESPIEEKRKRSHDFGAADVKNVEDYQTDFARRQGDKLITCLRDIVNTLDQFSDLVQECE
ncbi:hypothetical protein SLA2020_441850 [Shorea laevis]